MKAKVVLITIFVMMVLVTLSWLANIAVAKEQYITKGLLSYWSFDKATVSGKTYKDIVGGRDATVVGGNPKVVDGKFGEALKFNGSTDYLEYDPKGLPLKNAPRTFGCWVWPDGAGVRAVLEWGTRTATLRNSFLIESGEHVKFCGEGADLLTGDALKLRDWSLVTETYDGSIIRIYFNGKLVSQQAIAINTTIAGGPKAGFGRIGCNVEVAPGEFMNGNIDDAFIYDRQLSDAEVLQNFNVGQLILAVKPADKLAFTWGMIKSSK